MNIRTSLPTVRAASVLALAMTIAACGSAGSGSRIGDAARSLTLVNSEAQGAQAAATGVHVGQSVATMGVKLHDLADRASTVVNTLPGIGLIPLTFDCGSMAPVLFGRPTTPN